MIRLKRPVFLVVWLSVLWNVYLWPMQGQAWALSSTGTVTLEVNNPPVCPDVHFVVETDVPTTLDLAPHMSDPDGDRVYILSVTDPAHGTIAIDDNGTPNDRSDDVKVLYTPDAGYAGPDQFDVTCADR